MGLFDNLFGEKGSSRELTKQEAFAGILLGASACDGHIADEEVKGLFTITERMRMFENVSPNKWNAMMDVLAPALNSARSNPWMVSSASARQGTPSSSIPTERSEANGTISAAGKPRSRSLARMTVPTAPVAPTTATL